MLADFFFFLPLPTFPSQVNSMDFKGGFEIMESSAENNQGAWLGDYVRSAWGTFSFMYASQHVQFFIFILWIFSSLQDRLLKKVTWVQAHHYIAVKYSLMYKAALCAI